MDEVKQDVSVSLALIRRLDAAGAEARQRADAGLKKLYETRADDDSRAVLAAQIARDLEIVQKSRANAVAEARFLQAAVRDARRAMATKAAGLAEYVKAASEGAPSGLVPKRAVIMMKETESGPGAMTGTVEQAQVPVGYVPGEDDALYCVCNRPSFGDMVACDNPTCSKEWFHMACVGLDKAPRGRWICPLCRRPRGRPRKNLDPEDVGMAKQALKLRLKVLGLGPVPTSEPGPVVEKKRGPGRPPGRRSSMPEPERPRRGPGRPPGRPGRRPGRPGRSVRPGRPGRPGRPRVVATETGHEPTRIRLPVPRARRQTVPVQTLIETLDEPVDELLDEQPNEPPALAENAPVQADVTDIPIDPRLLPVRRRGRPRKDSLRYLESQKQREQAARAAREAQAARQGSGRQTRNSIRRAQAEAESESAVIDDDADALIRRPARRTQNSSSRHEPTIPARTSPRQTQASPRRHAPEQPARTSPRRAVRDSTPQRAATDSAATRSQPTVSLRTSPRRAVRATTPHQPPVDSALLRPQRRSTRLAGTSPAPENAPEPPQRKRTAEPPDQHPPQKIRLVGPPAQPSRTPSQSSRFAETAARVLRRATRLSGALEPAYRRSSRLRGIAAL